MCMADLVYVYSFLVDIVIYSAILLYGKLHCVLSEYTNGIENIFSNVV